ncbi:MAG: TIGR00725 family protein [Candidatus Thermoplasmatota archaeon]|nr:TIGR00725 family protein [Candidatus Thermoplasmatota archaeon]
MASDIIGVIGASHANDELLKLAEELGQEIASRGVAIVCGGMTGVMEAACKGARAKGGLTIGIIPSDDKNDANQYVQIPIVTGMGVGRNVMLVKTADVLIAVGGEYGTLSEIAHALNIGKKVISLRSWRLERATDRPIPGLIDVGSPKEAVDLALDAIAEWTVKMKTRED